MQNDEGINVDLYIPRKCSYSNRILSASDFGAVQINVGKIDPETGKWTGANDVFALSGFVRGQAEGDEALTLLSSKSN